MDSRVEFLETASNANPEAAAARIKMLSAPDRPDALLANFGVYRHEITRANGSGCS